MPTLFYRKILANASNSVYDMHTMLKSTLIEQLTSKLGHLSVADIDYKVNLLIEAMTDTIVAGGRIEIRDFGSFSLHYHPPRQAHNPKTGKRLITAAKYRPHFKPGKKLREQVNTTTA